MKIKLPKRNKLIIYTVVLFFVSFIFQTFLYNPASLIEYSDEIFTLMLVCFVMIKKKPLCKFSIIVVSMLIFILLLGFLGNILSGIKRETIAVLIDAFSIIKLLVVYICLNELIDEYSCRYIVRFLAKLFQVYIWIATLFYIPAYLMKLHYMFGQYRFGIGTYGFLFGAGAFGYHMMVAFCIISMFRKELKFEKLTRYMCLFLLLASLKGQAIMFVAFYVFLECFLGKRKFRWYHIVLLVIVGGAVGAWQIQKYILDPNEARAVVLVASVKIATDFFPLGSGFATFGTEMSKHFSFSPIYQMYNMTRIRGLNATDDYYLQDQYWSMLLGELGVIALIAFGIIYYKIYKQIRNHISKDTITKNAILASFFALMAAGIGSAYLTGTQGMMCFVLYSLYLTYVDKTQIRCIKIGSDI